MCVRRGGSQRRESLLTYRRDKCPAVTYPKGSFGNFFSQHVYIHIFLFFNSSIRTDEGEKMLPRRSPALARLPRDKAKFIAPRAIAQRRDLDNSINRPPGFIILSDIAYKFMRYVLLRRGARLL